MDSTAWDLASVNDFEQTERWNVQGDHCEYENKTKRGLISHKGHKHKDQLRSEVLSDEKGSASVDISSSPAQTNKKEKSSEIFKCDFFEYKNPNKPFMMYHMAASHSKYKCEKCKHYLDSEYILQMHMEEKHRIFMCDFCDFTSSSEKGRYTHRRKIHGW